MTKTLFAVIGLYNAYGDAWAEAAGLWSSKESAENQIAELKSIPRPLDQSRPINDEGHIPSFQEYDFDIEEIEIDKAIERFDPEPLLKELERRSNRKVVNKPRSSIG